jgi:hypothetical protein
VISLMIVFGVFERHHISVMGVGTVEVDRGRDMTRSVCICAIGKVPMMTNRSCPNAHATRGRSRCRPR